MKRSQTRRESAGPARTRATVNSANAANRKAIARLCAWFKRNARPLPWRTRRNGYTALVAEAMLQQTQVARVIQRFEAFMRAFPTVRDLAAADEQRVLALWQGLGYYRRARHLHQAARLIVAEFGGRVPSKVDDLRCLPGVGRYTAGAVASLAYGRREPIVDGNVQRVLARWLGNAAAPDAPGTIAWTWAAAANLVAHAAEPGALNEALMELGAMVCTPRSPRCDQCPVAKDCAAFGSGRQDQIPPAKSRAKPQAAHHSAVVVQRTNGDRILLEQRRSGGMWAGMWQAPTIESKLPLSLPQIRRALAVPVSKLERVTIFEHHTTHRRICFHVYKATSRARRGVWRRCDDLTDLPMGNAQRRVLEVVGLLGGNGAGGPGRTRRRVRPGSLQT